MTPEQELALRQSVEARARRRWPDADLNAPGTGFGNQGGYHHERFLTERALTGRRSA